MARGSAVNTRAQIIVSAVELFSTVGYSDTNLTQITDHAAITTGGFYHHFRSKDALAKAIIEESWQRFALSFAGGLTSRTPGLERVITTTFIVSELLMTDRLVQLGYRLLFSIDNRSDYRRRTQLFVGEIVSALRPSDLRDGVRVTDVGDVIWMLINGAHLMETANNDSVVKRFEHAWLLLLPALAPAESVAYLEQFVVRTADQYRSVEGLRGS